MPQSHSADLRPRSFRPDRARHLPQRREAPSASCECWTRERAIVFRGYSTIIFLVLVAWMHDLKSLREELLLSVARWQPEMSNSAPRSTLPAAIESRRGLVSCQRGVPCVRAILVFAPRCTR